MEKVNFHGGVQVSDGGFITMPLPPSTNARLGVSRGGFKYTTTKTKRWLSETERGLRQWFLLSKHPGPIDEYTFVDLWFVLPRSNADNHNYMKVLFDAVQNSEVFADDRYIIPRVWGVGHDTKNPSVVMRIVR